MPKAPVEANQWSFVNNQGVFCLPERGARIRCVSKGDWGTTRPITSYEDGCFQTETGNRFQLGAVDPRYEAAGAEHGFQSTVEGAIRSFQSAASDDSLLWGTDPGSPSPNGVMNDEMSFSLDLSVDGDAPLAPVEEEAGAPKIKPATQGGRRRVDITALAAEDRPGPQGEVAEPLPAAKVKAKKKTTGGIGSWPIWNWFRRAPSKSKAKDGKLAAATAPSKDGAVAKNTVAPGKAKDKTVVVPSSKRK